MPIPKINLFHDIKGNWVIQISRVKEDHIINSGRRHKVKQFLSSFAICGLIVTLFLGGWLGPFSTYIGWLFFLFKTYAVFFVMVWLRGTLPRLRVDQLMGFAWKFLLPMTLINIVVAAAWWYVVGPEWGAQVWTAQGMVRQLIGWAVGLAILLPSYTWLARLTFTAPELTEKAEVKP